MTALPFPALALASLPLPFAQALRRAVELGFSRVEIVARIDRPAEDLEHLADTGLLVAGAVLGDGLPVGCTLDAPDVAHRRQTLEVLKRQVADAARLGATWARLVPASNAIPVALTEACGLLAEYAQERMLRLCIGHAPGAAFSTAAAVLDWLEHDTATACTLALDVAAARAVGEDPTAIIARAGNRLGCLILPGTDPSLEALSPGSVTLHPGQQFPHPCGVPGQADASPSEPRRGDDIRAPGGV
jgi:sugar phosphate isomerase/epimerase